MSDVKTFEVAAKKASDDKGSPFRIPDLMDGREGREQTFTDIIAYEPDEGQFAVLMANTGRGASDTDRIAGFINFFTKILDEKGADYVIGRLLTANRIDPFGIEEVEDIMDWLTTEWTGNPTQGSSDSTPSPTPIGRSSTGSILS